MLGNMKPNRIIQFLIVGNSQGWGRLMRHVEDATAWHTGENQL